MQYGRSFVTASERQLGQKRPVHGILRKMSLTG